eukprot:364681-Chlamydomonas_euryale.AAC.2
MRCGRRGRRRRSLAPLRTPTRSRTRRSMTAGAGSSWARRRACRPSGARRSSGCGLARRRMMLVLVRAPTPWPDALRPRGH